MSEAAVRSGGQAVGASEMISDRLGSHTDRLTARPSDRLLCNRCGFPVLSKPWGCKNPCANCGTVYPLGDCSD